jgi:hypothetical protein
MRSDVQRAGRFISMTFVLAALAATFGGAASDPAGAAKSETGSWKAGDCFAQADVDADEVTLASKVPCSKPHEVQVLTGAALPASLAKAGIDTLTDHASSEHAQLVDFAERTCAPGSEAHAVYPKAAKKLDALLTEHDVAAWVPPAPGTMGWVLPDASSFTAGRTDLLCIFHSVDDPSNTTPGDVRALATDAALGGFRICFDFNAENTGTEAASCADVHDVESLFWIEQPVAGHPDAITDWTDADYSTFDAACRDFGRALVGASRRDLKIRADAADTPASNHGTRLFDCTAYPRADDLRLPAGSVVGAGTGKIGFVHATS